MDSRTALLNAAPERRRVAALMLPIVLAAIIAGLAAAVLTGIADRAVALGTARADLARVVAAVGRATEPGTEPAVAVDPVFLTGGTPAEIRANIRNAVSDMAEASGAMLLSVEDAVDRAGTARGEPAYAGLHATLQGTNPELIDTLWRVETAEPYLFVRAVRIAPADDGQVVGGRRVLTLRLHLEGALPPADGTLR